MAETMDLLLTEELRKKLKKPFGELFTDVDSALKKAKYGYIISVGDKVTQSLLRGGLKPDICIYDRRTQRREISMPAEIAAYEAEEVSVRNPAGTLTPESFKAIRDAVSSGKKTKIYVDGEEDLLTLAALSLAPEKSAVIYGQPDEGVVVIEVDQKIKDKVRKIIEEMIEK